MLMRPQKRAKIIATLHSEASVEFIRSLYDAGADVMRLNTAHLTIEEAAEMVERVRKASSHLAILIDTKGPEVRTCDVEETLSVANGDILQVVATPLKPEGKGFCVNYKNFVNEVTPGHRILLNDGEIELEIIDKKNGCLSCRVLNGGEIKNKKTVNVPDIELKMPSLTPRDREFIQFAIEHDIAFIAHSFVRNSEDVYAVRSILQTYQSNIHIIAKIENRQGVQNLDSILNTADGIMVARGDLGVEIPAEEVPSVQKQIIYRCVEMRKPVITATQMMQSMIHAPRPTRAEISDVANAVLDGSDAVMLSGETAQGEYPLESVQMMSRIISETERRSANLIQRPKAVNAENVSKPLWYLAKSAVEITDNLPIKAIICNTMSGAVARLISAYRPRVPIYALTFDSLVERQLSLSYGVYSNHNNFCTSSNEIVATAIESLLKRNRIVSTDLVLIIGNCAGTNRGGSDYMTISTPEEILTNRHPIVVEKGAQQ